MTFNLGAFAGGLAQGGVNTYKTLSDIESQKKKDELIQNQLDEARQQKEAAAATYGQVGAPETALPGRKLTPDEVTNAYAIDQGAPEAVAPKAYTKDQAAQDYAQRMYAINPEKAQQSEAVGYQLKDLKRTNDFNTEYDTARNDWNKKIADLHTGITGTFTTDGANGVIKKYGPEYQKATGNSIAQVGNDIAIKDKAGKTIEKFGVADLASKTEDAMKMHYTQGFADSVVAKGLFKNPNDAIAYMQKQQELGIAERGAKYKEARLPFENAKDNAYAGALSSKTGNWQPIGTDSDGTPISYDRNTGKYERADGKAVKDVSIFKKVSGEKQAKDPKVIEELSKGYAIEMQAATTGDQIKAVNKKYTELGLNTGYVDPVNAKLDALKGDPFAKDKVKAGASAQIAGTSGSHAAVDMPTPTGNAIPSPESRAKIKDINSRLALQGISDETRADLEMQRNLLLGRGINLPQSRFLQYGQND